MQDWTPIILNPKKEPVKKIIVAKKKDTTIQGVKLDEADEVISIKKISKELSTLIVNARVAKKLTRKELANQLNLKEDIIADIELGKAIYNGNQIAKIKKHLGIK
jgi:ribosome-binding protein aMBF1 (putative translation factor)